MNPGATFRGIHDSVVNHVGNAGPEFILCNHEEIAVAIAQGYGRAAGKPMAAFVHDIVGLLHASMAMFNAWMGRSGVLVLGATGPLDANHRRPWIDWIHTANVQGEAVRNFVKWDDQPSSVEASVESLIRAYNLVISEPQGPVYVCFDADVQEKKLTEPFQMPDISRFPAPTRMQADPAALERVASALMAAENPVVLANFLGRSNEAVQGLMRLAESLALPVINGGDFFNFPTHHPLYATESKEELLAEADVVLALDVYDLQQELTRLDRATRKTEDILRPDAMLIDVSLRQLAGEELGGRPRQPVPDGPVRRGGHGVGDARACRSRAAAARRRRGQQRAQSRHDGSASPSCTMPPRPRTRRRRRRRQATNHWRCRPSRNSSGRLCGTTTGSSATATCAAGCSGCGTSSTRTRT